MYAIDNPNPNCLMLVILNFSGGVLNTEDNTSKITLRVNRIEKTKKKNNIVLIIIFSCVR
jgi:hypothetical protein